LFTVLISSGVLEEPPPSLQAAATLAITAAHAQPRAGSSLSFVFFIGISLLVFVEVRGPPPAPYEPARSEGRSLEKLRAAGLQGGAGAGR